MTIKIQLYNNDCIQILKNIPDKSIDLILCDPPYGTTACSWDQIIDIKEMFNHLTRVIKDYRSILLFGAQPFSSRLRLQYIDGFKYDWIWVKSRKLGFTNAKNKPLNDYQIISVFSNGTCANRSSKLMLYNPQGLTKVNKKVSGKKVCKADLQKGAHKFGRKNHKDSYIQQFTGYPSRVIHFDSQAKPIHPTQKPIELLDYMIRTYSNPGQTVLDFTMGSGSTGVSCIRTDRNFIGIQMDREYFDLAKSRIQQEYDRTNSN